MRRIPCGPITYPWLMITGWLPRGGRERKGSVVTGLTNLVRDDNGGTARVVKDGLPTSGGSLSFCSLLASSHLRTSTSSSQVNRTDLLPDLCRIIRSREYPRTTSPCRRELHLLPPHYRIATETAFLKDKRLLHYTSNIYLHSDTHL